MANNNKSWEEVINYVIERAGISAKDYTPFVEWMQERESIGYLFDYFLYKVAFNICKRIENNGDHFTVIVGGEGTGKSTLASQLCAIVSPQSFGEKTMCFKIQDFIERVRNSKKGDSFQLDEGAMFLFAKESMSKESREIEKLFQLIRQRNLNIVVCIPRFFDISKYMRTHRIDLLLWIPTKGKYSYTAFRERAINLINKKESMRIHPPSGTTWRGYWNKEFPELNGYGLKQYIKNKTEHFNFFLDQAEKVLGGTKQKFFSLPELTKELGLGKTTLNEMIKQGRLEAIKIGNTWRIPMHAAESLRNGHNGAYGRANINLKGETNPK